jgi:hypothetical protein
MEVRDSLLLFLVVEFCMGPVFVVTVDVYRGAGVYMVPLWYRSILREKCVIGVKIYVGCWQCAKGLWVMRNGTYVWAHVIQLPVYASVSCSSHRGMYGEACVRYGRWSVDTIVPSLFLGLQNLLFGVLYVKALYVCVWCPVLICVYSEAQNCKVTCWYTIPFWALCDHRWYCKNTVPQLLTLCVTWNDVANALLDMFSY